MGHGSMPNSSPHESLHECPRRDIVFPDQHFSLLPSIGVDGGKEFSRGQAGGNLTTRP
jgi:hypothetical protein